MSCADQTLGQRLAKVTQWLKSPIIKIPFCSREKGKVYVCDCVVETIITVDYFVHYLLD